MNNKIKGTILLILSLFFASYAIGQSLTDLPTSRIKLNEPIQLEKDREYQFNYKHNIWDIFNKYEVSLVFDKKPNIVPITRYDTRLIEYRISVILKDKNKILYDSIVGRNSRLITGYSFDEVDYILYRYNYNIYDSAKFTLILRILETDPLLAELNPRVKVSNYLQCGFEVLFWGTSIIITSIVSIVMFIFGIKFLIKKAK